MVLNILPPHNVNLISILREGSWAGWFHDLIILGRDFEALIGKWGILLSL